MTGGAAEVWIDDRSVLFTSFWGWSPETWGTVGWSGTGGRTHRDKLLKDLSDPFICVCYVTGNRKDIDPVLKKMIAGFFLVSHETGDRFEFTHPIHHELEPEKWRHSLRAIRAFTFVPEYRCRAIDLFPELSRKGQPVARWGKIIRDPAKIEKLRNLPWVEVPVYPSRTIGFGPDEQDHPTAGMTRAGPASSEGYVVSEGTRNLSRELYVLRLTGDTKAYLGCSPDGESIYKIGLSFSPELRRQSLQSSMPRGKFEWQVEWTTRKDGDPPYSGFCAAVAGENAMKRHLMAANCKWLGGEFYLASGAEIAAAWEAGRQAARNIDREV